MMMLQEPLTEEECDAIDLRCQELMTPVLETYADAVEKASAHGDAHIISLFDHLLILVMTVAATDQTGQLINSLFIGVDDYKDKLIRNGVLKVNPESLQ